MSLALDGSASNFNDSAASLTLTLSTTQANDVIYLYGFISGTSFSQSVSSSHVTWAASARDTVQIGGDTLFTWKGTASGALSSEVITITWDTTAFVSAVVFAVSGANTSSPFDSGGSSNVPVGNTTGADLVIDTNNANTFIAAGYLTTDGTMTAGSGWTAIPNTDDSSTFLFVEYQIASSAQSSLSATFANDTSEGGIADAIVAASGGGGGSALASLAVQKKIFLKPKTKFYQR
jgi:hypothetical protein